MSDIYAECLSVLVNDDATYFPHIPKDVRDMIGQYYPRMYSYEMVNLLLREVRESMYGSGNDIRKLQYRTCLFDPFFREFLLYKESQAKDKVKWWAVRYKYHKCVNQRPKLEALAIHLHGLDFWDDVLEMCEHV